MDAEVAVDLQPHLRVGADRWSACVPSGATTMKKVTKKAAEKEAVKEGIVEPVQLGLSDVVRQGLRLMHAGTCADEEMVAMLSERLVG